MKRILLFSTALVSFALPTEAACFYPDGITIEPNHVPCNTTTTNSACCLPQDSCTTSGLCLGTTNFNYRGTCTDKTFAAAGCSQTCKQGKSSSPIPNLYSNEMPDPFNKNPYSSSTTIIPCGGPGAISNEFCCNSPGRNCCTIATFGLGSTGNSFFHGIDGILANLKAATSTSSIQPSSTSTTQTTRPSAPANNDNNNNNRTASPQPSSPLTIATTVGVAVGVPLGALVLGILGYLFYRARRTNPRSSSSSSFFSKPPPTPSKSPFAPTPPPALARSISASTKPTTPTRTPSAATRKPKNARPKNRTRAEDKEMIIDDGKRAYFEPGPPPRPPVEEMKEFGFQAGRRSSTWGSARTGTSMRDLPIIPERPRTGNRREGVRLDLI